MAKRHTVTIEIFGGWIVAYQDKHTFSVLQKGGQEDHHHFSLPDPAFCQPKVSSLALQGKHCVLILSRSYWLLSIEKHTGLTKRELQFAAELTKQTIYEDTKEEFVTIQSTITESNPSQNTSVFSAALPLAQVKNLEAWVQSLGLELDEIRVSSFQMTKNYTGNVLCIALYPDSWEVYLTQEGILQNTYSSNVMTSSELAKVLALMSLDYLTNGNARGWLDIPEQIELMRTQFECELHIYGQPSDILELGVATWQEVMATYGVSLRLKRNDLPGDIGSSREVASWPLAKLPADTKAKSINYPSLRVKSLRENKLKYPFSWFQTGIAVMLMISLALLGWVQWNQYQITLLHKKEADVNVLLSERVGWDEQISEFNKKVIYAQDFLENGTTEYDSLVHLVGSLPPGTVIERVAFSEETMDLVLASTLISEALLALERSTWFSSVTILSPIVQEDLSGHAMERVSLRLSYAKGEES